MITFAVGGCWAALAGLCCWTALTSRSCPRPPRSALPPRPVSRRWQQLGVQHSGLAMRPWALLASSGLTAVVLHPLPALAVPAVAVAGPRLQRRRQGRQRRAAIVDQLPDVIDLLRLTTLAGLPVSAALQSLGDLPGGPLGAAIQRAARQLSHGASTSQAVAAVAADGGQATQSLVDVLVDHDRYGTPLGPALDRVGIEARLQRRHQAEEAARRLPVTLLFPLVLTTLPACALLTVIPLLVASLSSLQP